MKKQVVNHVNTFLSPCLFGYRKGCSTQYTFLSLLERLKNTTDNKGFVGEVLMDLSTMFDILDHELLNRKLHAYGFGKEYLMLLFRCSSVCWQRTKINKSFSSWQELLEGVSQGLLIDSLLFNMNLNDLLYFLNCNV